MRTRALGRLTVTELGFGGSVVGNLYREVSDDEARAAIDAAWDGGVRYFDTAPHYGLGLSERRLGAALAGRPRDAYVLSTKVGRLLDPNLAPSGTDLRHGFAVPDDTVRRWDFSRDGVLRSLDDSLRRLGADRVDVVYVHDADDHLEQAVREAVPALVELREQGVVGAVGVGMNQWAAPLRLVRETDLDVVMLAGRWTLLDRSGAPLLAECAARGVSIVAAAPFNSGLLAHDRPPAGATYDYAPPPPDVLARAVALAGECERGGASLPAAALQFPLLSPYICSVVCGMGTKSEVRSALAGLAAPIGAQTWEALGCW